MDDLYDGYTSEDRLRDAREWAEAMARREDDARQEFNEAQQAAETARVELRNAEKAAREEALKAGFEAVCDVLRDYTNVPGSYYHRHRGGSYELKLCGVEEAKKPEAQRNPKSNLQAGKPSEDVIRQLCGVIRALEQDKAELQREMDAERHASAQAEANRLKALRREVSWLW